MSSRRDDSLDDGTVPDAIGDRSGRARVVALWEGGSITRWLEPGSELVLGRSSACEIAVDHRSVSRRHAVVRDGQPITIEDLGSANGVRVRGGRIAPHVAVPIFAGDVVELGSVFLVVQGHALPPRAPGPAADAGPMPSIERLVERVARSDLTVLVLGETGAGKNVLAQRIHEQSSRGSQPMVRIDCAALPEPLLEGELFGYERGAFTGAAQAKAGLLEAADGGTALLDEVGELSLSTQAKLLGVIENRELLRLGGLKARRIDVRFIAATNRDLESLVRSGAFRRDLFFRLDGVRIVMPPLRERRGDIPEMARKLLAEAARRANRGPLSISSDAMRWLVGHDWPGNIRELKNAMDRAAVICAGAEIGVADIAQHHRDPGETALPTPDLRQGVEETRSGLRGELESIERQRIHEALEACHGNQTKAAQQLGLSRRALIDRMTAYGFPRPRKR